MKSEFNQYIHVEGDAHIYTNVSGNARTGDSLLGIVIGGLAAVCVTGFAVAFLIHLLELAMAWVERHAVTLGITGTVVAAAACYIVYRTKKRDHAKALVSAPVADSVVADRCQPGHEPAAAQRPAVAPDRCHGEQPETNAQRQVEGVAEPRHRIPSRDIETVFFTEQPLTINRHE